MEFKIGDRVAYYQDGFRFKGVIHHMVESIHGGFGLGVRNLPPSSLKIVHSKQCRKLVKKSKWKKWVPLNCMLEFNKMYVFKLTDGDFLVGEFSHRGSNDDIFIKICHGTLRHSLSLSSKIDSYIELPDDHVTGKK